MYIGHFAVAFSAKRIAPSVTLGTLILAAQFPDLVWPTLFLLDIVTFQIRPGSTAVTPLDFVHCPFFSQSGRAAHLGRRTRRRLSFRARCRHFRAVGLVGCTVPDMLILSQA